MATMGSMSLLGYNAPQHQSGAVIRWNPYENLVYQREALVNFALALTICLRFMHIAACSRSFKGFSETVVLYINSVY
jgi:hypothetical protein